VDSSRGVGKHFQEIIFGFPGIFGYIENPLIFPIPLPFGFDFAGVISGLHSSSKIPIYCFDSPLFELPYSVFHRMRRRGDAATQRDNDEFESLEKRPFLRKQFMKDIIGE
jgi:hypothetical protein